MEIVTELDARRRGVFPPPFRPGDILVRESQDSGTITFRLVRRSEVPVVRPIGVAGSSMLPAGSASREAIANAIRAERDSR